MIYQNVSNIKYLKSYIDGYTKRGWILVEKTSTKAIVSKRNLFITLIVH